MLPVSEFYVNGNILYVFFCVFLSFIQYHVEFIVFVESHSNLIIFFAQVLITLICHYLTIQPL